METRSSTLAGDFIVAEEPAGEMAVERQLNGESRTAAEVVMDGALVQDDGIDLIVEELDRCWEVTQDQDKASKIEKAIYETQRHVKMETTFMSYVARRKLNFQQLENALGTPLPSVIKGYATLRDAKLAGSSCDKVVMWTGGIYARQSLQVPRIGYDQVSTDHTGTRFSMHCKRRFWRGRTDDDRTRRSDTLTTMVRR